MKNVVTKTENGVQVDFADGRSVLITAREYRWKTDMMAFVADELGVSVGSKLAHKVDMMLWSMVNRTGG
jgi:hypothetical protein